MLTIGRNDQSHYDHDEVRNEQKLGKRCLHGREPSFVGFLYSQKNAKLTTRKYNGTRNIISVNSMIGTDLVT